MSEGLPVIPAGWPGWSLRGKPIFYRHRGVWGVLGPEKMMTVGRALSVARAGRSPVAVIVGRPVARYVHTDGAVWLLCDFENTGPPTERSRERRRW